MRDHVLAGLAVLATLHPARVDASCNVIPAADRRFPSTLGEVTTPFARPGDTVTVRRETDAFAADPGANHITITFVPRGGPRTTLADVPPLAPADADHNLLVPLGFADLVPHGGSLTRFLQLHVPRLGKRGQVRLDSFTPDGEQLPPLLHHEGGSDDVIATADARESVLRVAQ